MGVNQTVRPMFDTTRSPICVLPTIAVPGIAVPMSADPVGDGPMFVVLTLDLQWIQRKVMPWDRS